MGKIPGLYEDFKNKMSYPVLLVSWMLQASQPQPMVEVQCFPYSPVDIFMWASKFHLPSIQFKLLVSSPSSDTGSTGAFPTNSPFPTIEWGALGNPSNTQIFPAPCLRTTFKSARVWLLEYHVSLLFFVFGLEWPFFG